MSFMAPMDDYRLIFKSMLKLDPLLDSDLYGDADTEDIELVLDTVASIAQNTLEPLQSSGDLHPATLMNGVVRTSPGYADGYKTLADAGIMGISADPQYGGSGLPLIVQNAANEFINGACIALGLNPLLTQSQIEALQKFAPAEIQKRVIPRLVSGEWYGTMNITEPQAGSDVGSIQARAVLGENGKYHVTGQKIYISWADADFASNVCHLVLARLPDAPMGTRGLSLFLVPKYLPDAREQFTIPNSVRILSLENKMGLHGSPTAAVSFEEAEAQLIGESGRGLEAMFAMMNNARLGVGSQGVGVAEAAYQKALAYAGERVQGRSDGRSIPIIERPDVQRMLATMRVQIFASRSICAACAYALDMERVSGSDYWCDRAALLTPIAKYYGSETGVEVSDLALRIHGGSGYVEGTGISQFLRDSMVTTIYEGTNGIQAHDLVTRKLGMNGETVCQLVDDVNTSIRSDLQVSARYVSALCQAGQEVVSTTKWIIEQSSRSKMIAGAQPFTRALALYLGGYFHLLRLHAHAGNNNQGALAEVCFSRFVPYISPLCQEVRQGDAGLIDFVSEIWLDT